MTAGENGRRKIGLREHGGSCSHGSPIACVSLVFRLFFVSFVSSYLQSLSWNARLVTTCPSKETARLRRQRIGGNKQEPAVAALAARPRHHCSALVTGTGVIPVSVQPCTHRPGLSLKKPVNTSPARLARLATVRQRRFILAGPDACCSLRDNRTACCVCHGLYIVWIWSVRFDCN